jgi:hypothetical protein
MPDDTATKAEASLQSALDSGQSISEGNLSVQKTPARDAYDILRMESDRAAQKTGRRPLFRGINMGTLAS